ncbi:DUF362 domain-containing protein [Anaerolinea thermophila]|nr:DUF362 domain-containing protein [Anaerolinea thermophila]
MVKKISRRKFLALISTGAISTWIGITHLRDQLVHGQSSSFDTFIPIILKPNQPTVTPTPSPPPTPTSTPKVTQPPPASARVVHVRHTSVTNWTGSPYAYWNYVNQTKVNLMVEQGLKTLTGQSNLVNAWQVLLPNYVQGEGIAIKVNFNNAMQMACGNETGQINALPQLVIALIGGLKARGVAESDIKIYDGVNRIFPLYFINAIHSQYPNVQLFHACADDSHKVTYNSSNPSATVQFSPPSGVPSPAPQKIADVLVNATYLINIPIMKNHSCAGITLAFKNHFGTISNPGGVHSHVFFIDGCGGGVYSNYSPLVDIYKNSNIRNKTILTVGDGIFGCLGSEDGYPSFWINTFGQGEFPKSLFFSRDPVAIDSVMADFLRAEYGYFDGSDKYLQFAQDAGLGTYERGDPWGSGYSRIDYQKIVLS